MSARQARSAPLVAAFGDWLQAQRRKISSKSRLGEKLTYIHNHWNGLQTFLTDGRVEIDNNRVENLIRPIAKHVSLYTPSLSVCKHWKCVGVSNATRASFSGYGSFDRLRRQVIGTDLIRRTGYKLHSRKDVGFDKVPDHVVCDA
jgi:transposase